MSKKLEDQDKPHKYQEGKTVSKLLRTEHFTSEN